MREPIDKILQKLAVTGGMHPYETRPWFYSDDVRGYSCSAEVRMGSGGKDVEAEIQLLREEVEQEDGEATDGGSTDTSGAGGVTLEPGGYKQILWMRVEPATDSLWSVKGLRVMEKSYVNEFHDWEAKGCQFFRSCIESIQMGEMPEFESLVKENMKDDTSGANGSRGRIGRKSPKANPAALMGMKK